MNYLNKEKCENLKGKEVFIPQFPKQEDLSYSSGKIEVINDNYEFCHLAKTDFGSSGSPIFLINNTKVIGIHKAGSKKENYGDFIWPIYDFLKNDIKLKKFLFNTNIFDKVNISTSRNGYGKSSYDNGDNYIGNLREGIPNGRGALYDRRNNKKFEGNFIDGEPVNGIYYYENGEYYKGPLNNKLQQGIGQLFLKMEILNMKENLKKALKKEKENIFMKMGNITKEISIIIECMEKGNYSTIIIIFIMKEISQKINSMEKANIYMKMGIIILALLKIIKKMDMEKYIIKTGILFMKGVLLGMFLKEKENMFMTMEVIMLENLKMEINM